MTVTDTAHGLPESHPADGQVRPAAIDVLNSQSLAFVEEKYAEYLRHPEGLPADWRRYFDALRDGANGHFLSPAEFKFPRRSLFHRSEAAGPSPTAGAAIDHTLLQERVDRLVHAYRVRGHIAAHIDPLGQARADPPELDPAFYGLTPADLDRPAAVPSAREPQVRTVRQIVAQMRNTYCRFIGAPFMHIDELSVRK